MPQGSHHHVSGAAAVQRVEFAGGTAWVLLTRHTAILLYLDERGLLHCGHWGAGNGSFPIEDWSVLTEHDRRSEARFLDGSPLVFPVYGDPTFKEPCLVAARESGNREASFTFVVDRILDEGAGPILELDFHDTLLELRLTHRFRVLPELDLVVRSAAVINEGPGPLSIERLLSAALPLPPGAYEAWTLHGQWGHEFQLHRRLLEAGKLVVESRRGTSSHEAHPWFAVTPRAETTEHGGPVWFGSLAWSGNWIVIFEVERNDAVSIAVGLQPFDFAWRLESGERFATPELVCGYSEAGLGGASRLLHAYEETVVLPAKHRDVARPVLYNSWEATDFEVRLEHQVELAHRAAELGVELFVVDDGWFGARDHDRAGLGDWTVNRQKFPHGLRPLIDEVHRLGMSFGIWVEPEMVNPDSDLYRAHPDWVFHAEGREPILGRHQLVLNYAREDVRQNILGQLRALLTQHGRIDFIKWDHNRPWIHVGWQQCPQRQREAWVRHVRGLYAVLGELRAKFPHLLIETCASGGGRADLGMFALTDQAWTSDNTDAGDRIPIQYGYTRAHSPRTMVNWVTDVPNQQTGRHVPLEFRFHVAMQGVLGIGGNIARWNDEDFAIARQLVADYKAIRSVVQQGRLYWLLPPASAGLCAAQYVSQSGDAAVLLLYEVHGIRGKGTRRLRLQGLIPGQRYRRDGDGAESSGAALMRVGLPLVLSDPFGRDQNPDYRSVLQVWHAVNP